MPPPTTPLAFPLGFGQSLLWCAEALLREALALMWAVGDPRACAETLGYLAATAGAAGQGAHAARIWGAAAAVRETIGAPLPAIERSELEQAVAPARAALGEAAWATVFAAGQALSLEQANAEALGKDTAAQADDQQS